MEILAAPTSGDKPAQPTRMKMTMTYNHLKRRRKGTRSTTIGRNQRHSNLNPAKHGPHTSLTRVSMTDESVAGMALAKCAPGGSSEGGVSKTASTLQATLERQIFQHPRS
jgi:hypothetical protein